MMATWSILKNRYQVYSISSKCKNNKKKLPTASSSCPKKHRKPSIIRRRKSWTISRRKSTFGIGKSTIWCRKSRRRNSWLPLPPSQKNLCEGKQSPWLTNCKRRIRRLERWKMKFSSLIWLRMRLLWTGGLKVLHCSNLNTWKLIMNAWLKCSARQTNLQSSVNLPKILGRWWRIWAILSLRGLSVTILSLRIKFVISGEKRRSKTGFLMRRLGLHMILGLRMATQFRRLLSTSCWPT